MDKILQMSSLIKTMRVCSRRLLMAQICPRKVFGIRRKNFYMYSVNFLNWPDHFSTKKKTTKQSITAVVKFGNFILSTSALRSSLCNHYHSLGTSWMGGSYFNGIRHSGIFDIVYVGSLKEWCNFFHVFSKTNLTCANTSVMCIFRMIQFPVSIHTIIQSSTYHSLENGLGLWSSVLTQRTDLRLVAVGELL